MKCKYMRVAMSCAQLHDRDCTTFRGTVEHTVYITKSIILCYGWSDSKRVLAFVL